MTPGNHRQILAPVTGATGIDGLTPRQREILELLAKGLTNDETGGVLGISRV